METVKTQIILSIRFLSFLKNIMFMPWTPGGMGSRPRGEAPFTLEQFALDLEAFMDEKGLEQADILGFSDGANIALLFALRHPRRVGRLILNGGQFVSQRREKFRSASHCYGVSDGFPDCVVF